MSVATCQLLPLDPDTYQPHPLHSTERDWTETNCYVDVWVEVLHAFGFDPLAAAAFTLSADFDGRQWTFFKFPPEDLRDAFGIEVAEINVWLPVLEHVVEELSAGRLLTVEVDSWYLPDTAGVSYRLTHGKTTIVPQQVDVASRRLGYFHNAGYHQLSGEDFAGVFRLEGFDDPNILPPYVEAIAIPADRPAASRYVETARRLTTTHLRRRPADNPVVRLAEGVAGEIDRISAEGIDYFHAYSFGTLRQCGATAELASAYTAWLNYHDGTGLEIAAERFAEVSAALKGAQFRMARIASGKAFDVPRAFEPIAEKWDQAMSVLEAHYG